jgi:hypothetical protein
VGKAGAATAGLEATSGDGSRGQWWVGLVPLPSVCGDDSVSTFFFCFSGGKSERCVSY